MFTIYGLDILEGFYQKAFCSHTLKLFIQNYRRLNDAAELYKPKQKVTAVVEGHFFT